MSYSLLWIEALLTSLLWVATLVACAMHIGRKWICRLSIALVALVPLVLFGALTVAAAVLKFHVMLEHNWFVYGLSLFIGYGIGMLIILDQSRHLSTLTGGRAGATWPRGRLALALVTTLAITTMTFWNMDLEVRSQAANLRNEAGAMMLSVSPPPVSDSRNAGLVYEKAFARLAADKEGLHGPDSPLEADSPDEKQPATAALLKHHEATLKLLRKAATMPDGRFDHDYAHPSVSMLLPEMSHVRLAARLLRLDARIEMARGHVEAAAADVNAIFHLGRMAGDEPILISGLVAIAIDDIGIETLQDLLPAVTKGGELEAIDLGNAPLDARMMSRSLRGEEAFGLSTFGDLSAGGEVTLSMLNSLASQESGQPKFQVWDIPPTASLMRVFLIPDDEAAFREMCHGFQALAAKPYYQIAANEETPSSVRGRGVVTQFLAPAFRRVLEIAVRANARHSDAQVAVAMTHYRLDHGSLPASLDLLVPDYLDEVPLDPFDGKPLRLMRKGDEWIIYSIGPDGKDDGGAAYDPNAKTGDLPFVLKIAAEKHP